ncbi:MULTISPECIES: hypothetical protein [Anaeromyxobacter]|uniref:hypothetical protein n=1 Tax=Anaeromyxobacter TaxID=161492 RepID=UPI001F57E5DF|nr:MULTISPECIES: hypothetical protein [unclassified Anaeromyxobacter]
MREPDEKRDQRAEEAERRRAFTVLGLLQVGGLGLLAVIAVGLVPRVLASSFPSLGAPWITAAAAIVAAFGAVALSLLRLRRVWRDSDRDSGGDSR